ncbi:MAG: class I SAM-dependent methyltransferase [Candidatus Heimdallarchaeaceae archaeon]|jgi:demethylmenaquinone methyltransferase/2-methoxy-6-polyprenyl-1,4-benzoquinol methylase
MDHFSRYASEYDNIVSAFDLDKIAEYLPLHKDDILLDIGGGTGRVAILLEKVVNECIVFDLSFDMLLEAKRKSKSLFLIQGSSTSLPFRKNSIKQIFVNDTLHHIKEQQKTLEESYNVIKPKGKLIIREYNRKYFWNIFLILFEKIMRFGSKFLSPKQLSEMCQQCGFKTQFHKPTKSTFVLIGEK